MRRDSVAFDVLCIAGLLLVFAGAGIGLRDPWPADEPRFASIARDMVLTGDWLFPRVGGDLYQDKPPLFFWLLAICHALFGAFRGWFQLPSLLAAFGTLVLVYDLVRRLHGRQAGLAATVLLVCTLQFLLAARAAQIDATLCFLTTASLYGLLRHLLSGPAWGWYFASGVAAGLGVITKGVGFLPLLVLLPYAVFRRSGFEPLLRTRGDVRWWLAPLGLVLGIAVWFVPMLSAVARSDRPELEAYRDELLFRQTVERYAAAWHHIEPWYYFVVEVIPALWLPLSVLLVWLVREWRGAWRARDARVWLPLSWSLLVLLFFSLSAGKRGIYLLPALPAMAIAAAPYLLPLMQRSGVRRASLALAAVLPLLAVAFALAAANGVGNVRETLERFALGTMPFVVFAVLGAGAWMAAWRRRPVLAWPAVLASLALVWSFLVTPAIDGERSTSTFMRHALAQVRSDETLGLIAYKEQFLLYLDAPVVNFGHRRWEEGKQEMFDAAKWLARAPRRVLLVPAGSLAPCFERSARQSVGHASRSEWFLVRGPVDKACVDRGDATRAITYSRRSSSRGTRVSQNAQN